eukprot:gene56114-20942_t
MVSSATQRKKEEERKRPSERQKNKLFARGGEPRPCVVTAAQQGFVSVEQKSPKRRPSPAVG